MEEERWIEEGIKKKEPELEDSENFQPIHIVKKKKKRNETEDFTGGQVVKNPPSNTGDIDSIPV